MSEYIPKYPSKEDDDSNKTSSEILAETLKPIYVPQDLMLAWESHLASYSRDTHVLLEQVKESEEALNAQYQALLARVQKYEQMLQDITMDSNEFTMDSDVENFTGWNILAQASYWDYLLRKEITKLRDQIKSVEFKGELVADVSDTVLESLSTGNQYISNVIGALTDSPLIRNLDAALSGTSTGLSELRLEHEKLKAKQYADAIALAEQNGETFDQLTLRFNDLISEQIDRIADEAATRTRLIQELEDGITAEAQLRHEGQEAIATQVLAIKTSTETAVAGILQEYSTIAGTNEAITSALTTYSAQVDDTIATVLTDYVAYANLDAALTSKSEELLAIVNDNIGKLTATNEISASLDKVKAVNTLTVDINGVVSGYGLISELENGVVKSAFGVNADTFYIGKPTDKVKPFVVTTKPTNIDGVDFPAGTWINSAIIANATIGTAHIADAAITNAKIKELDASKITTGILEAKRIRVGDTTQFDFGFAPTDILSDAKTYTDTKTKTFTAQPTTPYAKGDIYRNGSSIYVCTTGRASGSYVASDWTLVGDVTSLNTAADSNKLGGTAAATVLDNAAKGIAVYNDVMSDLKITPVEKTALNTEWARIKAEYSNVFAHATSVALSTTALTTAYNALNSTAPTMTSILSSMTTTTTLTAAQRDALRTQFTNYYAEVTALSKAISDRVAAVAKAQADAKAATFTSTPVTPYSTGDLWRNGAAIYVCTTARSSGAYTASDWTLVGDVTAYNTAADTAKVNGVDAATVASNAANGAAVYSDVMSDLKITPVEKTAINQEWNRIQKEYSSLLAQAQGLGLTTTTYTSAYNGLSTTAPTMSTILSSMTTTTTLTAAQRDAYKTRYTTYYAEAVAITKAITDKIAANAKAQADAKAKTFTAEPVPPYSAGDLWKSGTTIKVSTVTRASGSYVAADWVLVGDVTSANTAADANKLGGKTSATVFSDIAAAKSTADSATSQLTLWKYPNTTYIDGGKIYANSITSNQINVDKLSAITSDLGTIQVGTANIAKGAITTAKIGDLQVDTLQIKGNAVTVPVSAFAEAAITVSTSYVTVQTLNVPSDMGHTILTYGAVFSFKEFAAKQQLLCRVLKDGDVVFEDLEVFFLDSATIGKTTNTSGSHDHNISVDVTGTISSAGNHSHGAPGGNTGSSNAGDWSTNHYHSYGGGNTSSAGYHDHGLSLRSSASTKPGGGHTHTVDIQNQSRGAGTLNLSRHDSTGIAGKFQLQLRSASGGNVTVSQRYIHAMTMRK